MAKNRKYQVSIGLSNDIIVQLDKKVASGNYSSRSSLVEDLIRQNITDMCPQCDATKKLIQSKHFHIDLTYPLTMDAVNDYIETEEHYRLKRRIGNRNIKIVLEKVRNLQNQESRKFPYANKLEVLKQCEKHEISEELFNQIVERLVREGRLMFVRGPETLHAL